MTDTAFSQFFYKKAKNEPVQRIAAQQAAAEYAVLPQRLVQAYEEYAKPAVQNARTERIPASQIAYEMEELRKSRLESQQTAQIAVWNQTIRAQKSQIDQLQSMVQDILTVFKQVQNDMKELKSQQAEMTQKYGKFSYDFSGKFDVLEKKIGQAVNSAAQQVTTSPAQFMYQQQQTAVAEQQAQNQAPDAAVSPAAYPAQGDTSQNAPPAFKFNQGASREPEKQAFTVAANSKPEAAAFPAAGAAAGTALGQPKSTTDAAQFSFNQQSTAPPPFSFGQQQNYGFGTAQGGFGQSKPSSFQFGAAPADNPFSNLFNKQY